MTKAGTAKQRETGGGGIPEALLAQKGMVYPDDLGTLLIHCHRVEVVHLDVGLWPDGVRNGA